MYEIRGAVRVVVLATRFCGPSKPRNCLTSRKQTSRGQCREQLQDLCVAAGHAARYDALVKSAFVALCCASVLLADGFSQDRAMAHIRVLAGLKDRSAGTTGESEGFRYVENALRETGLEVRMESFTFFEEAVKIVSANLVATTRDGKPDREVILSAHIDSAGTPGAQDNASGVAVLLELNMDSIGGKEIWIDMRDGVRNVSAPADGVRALRDGPDRLTRSADGRWALSPMPPHNDASNVPPWLATAILDSIKELGYQINQGRDSPKTLRKRSTQPAWKKRRAS